MGDKTGKYKASNSEFWSRLQIRLSA
jgi:hypothetical protein